MNDHDVHSIYLIGIGGAPIGHTFRPMLTLPFGVRARLRAAGEGRLEILEPAVCVRK